MSLNYSACSLHNELLILLYLILGRNGECFHQSGCSKVALKLKTQKYIYLSLNANNKLNLTDRHMLTEKVS